MIDFQNITLHPDYENLLKEVNALKKMICDLLCKKDTMILQTGPSLEAQYHLRIGVLECKAFEFQCEMLKLKRKIELVQKAINRQEQVEIDLIEKILIEEHRQYTQKLDSMKAKVSDAIRRKTNMSKMEPDKAAQVTKTYFQIVRKLHPDVNPHAKKSDKDLLQIAMRAFEQGALDTLEAIAASIETIDPDITSPSAMDELKSEYQRLLVVQDNIQSEIDEIFSSFPFDQTDLLADEEMIEKRRVEWTAAIDSYKSNCIELQDRLARLLNNGGLYGGPEKN